MDRLMATSISAHFLMNKRQGSKKWTEKLNTHLWTDCRRIRRAPGSRWALRCRSPVRSRWWSRPQPRWRPWSASPRTARCRDQPASPGGRAILVRVREGPRLWLIFFFVMYCVIQTFKPRRSHCIEEPSQENIHKKLKYPVNSLLFTGEIDISEN